MTDAQDTSHLPSFAGIALGLLLLMAASVQVDAMDFLEKRECTLARPGRAPVHTSCVILGGIQVSTIDVSIKDIDGKQHSLEVAVDDEDGQALLLERRPASKAIDADDGPTQSSGYALAELSSEASNFLFKQLSGPSRSIGHAF